MKSKAELLEMVDELRYAEVFEELDNMGLNSEAYNRLKKEFILGKTDIDFNDRLKTFIRVNVKIEVEITITQKMKNIGKKTGLVAILLTIIFFLIREYFNNIPKKEEEPKPEITVAETKKYTVSGKLYYNGKALMNYQIQINGTVSNQKTAEDGTFMVYDVTVDETDLAFKIRKNEKEEWKTFTVSKGQFEVENTLMKVKKGILEVPIAITISQNPPVRNPPTQQTNIKVGNNNGVINTGDNTTINYNTSFTSN